MFQSAACNLANLSPEELIKRGEEPEEMGGYFIVNGNEKVIRMITMPRRNYVSKGLEMLGMLGVIVYNYLSV